MICSFLVLLSFSFLGESMCLNILCLCPQYAWLYINANEKMCMWYTIFKLRMYSPLSLKHEKQPNPQNIFLQLFIYEPTAICSKQTGIHILNFEYLSKCCAGYDMLNNQVLQKRKRKKENIFILQKQKGVPYGSSSPLMYLNYSLVA